jgi:hypothetical protein
MNGSSKSTSDKAVLRSDDQYLLTLADLNEATATADAYACFEPAWWEVKLG